MTTNLSVEELQILKDKLPRGYRKKVAKITNKTEWTIDKVLAGKYHNQTIIDACFKVLADSIKEQEKQSEKNEEHRKLLKDE